MLTLTLLLSLFCIFSMLYLVRVQLYWKLKKVKTSLRASTIGNLQLLFLQKNLSTVCDELYRETKEKYIGFFIFGKPCILIKDLNIIKRVFVKDFEYFDDRTVASNYELDPIGSRTLFFEKNPVWKFSRSKIASFFSTGKMKEIFPQMVETADNFIEYLATNEGKPISLPENCTKYSMSLVISCAFGIEENCFKSGKIFSRIVSKKPFLQKILKHFQFSCHLISPFLTKLFNMKRLDPAFPGFITSMFNDIKERRTREGPKDDYVGRLIKLEEQNMFYSDPQEIIAQAATFFLAGFETVASTVMFALYELARNEDIQHKLRESIKTYVQPFDGKLTYEAVMNVEYLVNVVQETLRIHTILAILDRKTKTDYYIPEDDITIDAGTNVYISLQGIHRDPAYYPNPMKFDPDRFSSESKHEIVQNSYLAFGDGPRNCIGARFGKIAVRTAIAKIVMNFKVSLVNKTEELRFDPKTFLLTPTKKISLIFHKL